tara:strand:+ start:178 stop:366 length:189 start_codon:yes stop_codon:yes gene_type:complete
MSYHVYLIEQKKRSFLRSFLKYKEAASYCKQGKIDDPNVWFVVQAYSSKGSKMTLMLNQEVF